MEPHGFLQQALVYLAAGVIAVPLCKRLGLGSVLGYLVAGMAIGPWGLRLIADPQTVLQFSEFGVVLLLFLIGLELNPQRVWADRKSTRLNSSHGYISYAVFCLKKKKLLYILNMH